jgi:hypothetical protein
MAATIAQADSNSTSAVIFTIFFMDKQCSLKGGITRRIFLQVIMCT